MSREAENTYRWSDSQSTAWLRLLVTLEKKEVVLADNKFTTEEQLEHTTKQQVRFFTTVLTA